MNWSWPLLYCLITIVVLVYVMDEKQNQLKDVKYDLQRATEICVKYKTKWVTFIEPRILDEEKKPIRCE